MIFFDDSNSWFEDSRGWKWSGNLPKILIYPNFYPVGVSGAIQFKMNKDFRRKVTFKIPEQMKKTNNIGCTIHESLHYIASIKLNNDDWNHFHTQKNILQTFLFQRNLQWLCPGHEIWICGCSLLKRALGGCQFVVLKASKSTQKGMSQRSAGLCTLYIMPIMYHF